MERNPKTPAKPIINSLSKYVLSNIINFLPIQQAIEVRQLNFRFDDAVRISLNCQYFDIKEQVERYEYILETQFDQNTQKQHKTLREKEMSKLYFQMTLFKYCIEQYNQFINGVLKDCIKKAGKGGILFKNFKELSYMAKPNHLIEKPIIAVLILLHQVPKVKQNVDYMNKADIDQIWVKIRDHLKNKQFLKQLENFDIRMVGAQQIQQVQDLFANDPWMTTGWIRRESSFALNLFIWVNYILEYVTVAQEMRKLGLHAIEDKRDQSNNIILYFINFLIMLKQPYKLYMLDQLRVKVQQIQTKYVQVYFDFLDTIISVYDSQFIIQDQCMRLREQSQKIMESNKMFKRIKREEQQKNGKPLQQSQLEEKKEQKNTSGSAIKKQMQKAKAN